MLSLVKSFLIKVGYHKTYLDSDKTFENILVSIISVDNEFREIFPL